MLLRVWFIQVYIDHTWYVRIPSALVMSMLAVVNRFSNVWRLNKSFISLTYLIKSSLDFIIHLYSFSLWQKSTKLLLMHKLTGYSLYLYNPFIKILPSYSLKRYQHFVDQYFRVFLAKPGVPWELNIGSICFLLFINDLWDIILNRCLTRS